LFAALSAGELGSLDPQSLYAMGISSGGYMTSRMAVSYQGKFKALAIASGSYATCGGLACVVPPLPSDHPPTLFLHGDLDAIVPIQTMESYRSALKSQGLQSCEVVDRGAGHQWLTEGPGAVLAWFEQHP
jgi:predicted esterase